MDVSAFMPGGSISSWSPRSPVADLRAKSASSDPPSWLRQLRRNSRGPQGYVRRFATKYEQPAAPPLAWPVVHSAAEPPLMPSPLRFPPPSSVDEQEGCCTVRDANGQALAYVHFEGSRATARLRPWHSKSSKRLDDRKHPRAAERFCTVTIACHDRDDSIVVGPPTCARNFMEIAVGSAIPRREACRCTVLPVDLGRSSEDII